jgi:hypothetical protein
MNPPKGAREARQRSAVFLEGVHILNQRIHLIVAHSAFKGRHDAATVQDDVPQLIICGRRAAWESLFPK